MLITLFVALLIIGITYRKRAIKLKDVDKPFHIKYRELLIIIGIVLIPILLLNLFRPKVWLTEPDELLENAIEYKSESEIIDAYEYNLNVYPDSVPLYLAYVERYVDYCNYDEDDLRTHIYSYKPYYQQLCLTYADALSSEFSLEDTLLSSGEPQIPLEFDENVPYHNYIQAAFYAVERNGQKAELHLLKEIKLNPNYDNSYLELYYYYKTSDRDKLRGFITTASISAHLPSSQLQQDYYVMGEYGLYLKEIYSDRWLDINLLALLAGLLISIVWIYFLREMDFFDKERWVDIIGVFILGALFTNLCLFIYSYAHYDLNLHINGEGWNDFFYCSGVIGFSEEFVKMIPWVIFVLISKRVNEPYDYILYASASALGFAFAENLMYLESSQSIVTRAIMSTIAHMFFASLVAYAVVLAKYKYKNPLAKILIVLAGFIAACLAHGFYDFWLISPGFTNYSVITTIFFLLSVHVWFFMINNATNHSQFFSGKPLKLNRVVDFLNFSFIALIMIQFMFLSYEYGAYSANKNLSFTSWFPVAFLLYIAFVISDFKPIRGVWTTYSFPFMPFINDFITFPRISKSSSYAEDHVGKELRLFAPKTNRYVGRTLPTSGVCQKEIQVNGQDGWYIFRLNKAIGINGYRQMEVIIKPKSEDNSLSDDKVEIYLMLIPLDRLILDAIPITELRYVGKSYSRVVT